MSIYKQYIKHLIEEEVNKNLFIEQEEQPEADEAPEAEQATDDAPAVGGEDEIDLGGDDAPGGGDLGDAGGVGEIDLGDDEDAGDVEGEELIGGGLGGGFGGGFGGGGFSFGGDGEPGLSPDDEKEAETATTIGPEDVEIPDDPIMAITDDAIKILDKTKDPGDILKTVKSSIQKYFDEFEDATPVIKALWDTEDLILRDVARRLLLFIKGV